MLSNASRSVMRISLLYSLVKLVCFLDGHVKRSYLCMYKYFQHGPRKRVCAMDGSALGEKSRSRAFIPIPGIPETKTCNSCGKLAQRDGLVKYSRLMMLLEPCPPFQQKNPFVAIVLYGAYMILGGREASI